MSSKHTKRYLTPLVIRKRQVKIIIRYTANLLNDCKEKGKQVLTKDTHPYTLLVGI